MPLDKKVLIVGGTGWIGGAFAKRFMETGVLHGDHLLIANQSGHRGFFDAHPEVQLMPKSEAQDLIDQADVVILAIRPKHFRDLTVQLHGQLVISVMAGVSIKKIQSITQSDRVIRVMPNAGCILGESFTPYFPADEVGDEDIQVLETLLGAVGEYTRVKDEDAINFLTALAGSAPGMLTFYVSAYIHAAVEYGFDREMAETMAKQVFAGSAAFIKHDEESPEVAMKTMLNYQGTTAEGIQTLIDSDVEEVIKKSIRNAYEKARSDMMES